MANTNHYLTGTTALNIGHNDRPPALWHSTGIVNQHAWTVAGVDFQSTTPLIGYWGIHDGTEDIQRVIPDLDSRTFVASHERALFDLLHEFIVVRKKPVPNVQATDIDDVVDYSAIMKWIDQAETISKSSGWDQMRAWLKNSDYEF